MTKAPYSAGQNLFLPFAVFQALYWFRASCRCSLAWRKLAERGGMEGSR